MGRLVQVRGRYLDGDRPATGTVTFTPSGAWTDAVTGVAYSESSRVAHLVLGEFRIDLLATDAADVLPLDRWWTVNETISGRARRSFALLLPSAEAAVDLADYAPVDPPDTDPQIVPLRLALMSDVDLSRVPVEDGRYMLTGGAAVYTVPVGTALSDDIPDGSLWVEYQP